MLHVAREAHCFDTAHESLAMKKNAFLGRAALMIAHCAGMVDLIALPVWVGTLIANYRLDPQEAGGLVTTFLFGAVASSVYFSSRFDRLASRAWATAGYALSAAAFLTLASVGSTSYLAMLGCHALGGIAAGCGLSFTHGTIARSGAAHRLFALVGLALGIFAIAFMGAVPKVVEIHGGPAFFKVLSVVMAIAAVVCALAFPPIETDPFGAHAARAPAAPLSPATWFCVIGVSLMAVNQAMTFSFVERMGVDRGFGRDAVTAVLVSMGIVNLIPAALAALLERRLAAESVVRLGPVVQAALAVTLTWSSAYSYYAVSAGVFVAVMIFTHTYAFGLLARLDPSGRAAAATPAMLMIGSGLGPIIGGTLVKFYGYPAIGLMAVVVAGLAVLCFSQTSESNRTPEIFPVS